MSAHTCLGCGGAPRLRRNAAKRYRAECSNPACRWNPGDGGLCSREGARTRWHRDNKPNCEETLLWWRRRYHEMYGLPPLPVALSAAEVTQINRTYHRAFPGIRGLQHAQAA